MGVAVGDGARLEIDGSPIDSEAWTPTSFSSVSEAVGRTVVAGHGIVALDLGIDDYRGIDVQGKIAIVRRFVPQNDVFDDPELERRYSDLQFKAFIARERGARALLVVDAEAELPSLAGAGASDVGIPIAVIRGETAARLLDSGAEVRLRVEFTRNTTEAYNVLGRIPAVAAERVAALVAATAQVLAAQPGRLTYRKVADPAIDCSAK